MELNNALALIAKGLDEQLSQYELKPRRPEGKYGSELPVFTQDGKSYLFYEGTKGRVRIEYTDGKLALYCANSQESEVADEDMGRESLSLLELDTYNENDIKYICEDYSETLASFFGIKRAKDGKKKLPTPVSKTAAKSGALSYDLTTLGSRFVGIYPELKDDYRRNVETYGEFLAEEFFESKGASVVIQTLKGGDKIKLRRLFNLLNEIYEDGTNETQSLIAVTLLGGLSEYPELAELAYESMSETMRPPVEEVIKYLASSKSRSAKLRLKNPPPYTPPKKKKKSITERLTGQ